MLAGQFPEVWLKCLHVFKDHWAFRGGIGTPATRLWMDYFL